MEDNFEIKKPKYVRKYDFCRYFYRNKDEWFWPTDAIKSVIDSLTAKLHHGEEISYDEDEESEAVDTYEAYKELVIVGKIDLGYDINEDSDPKIIEGNKIDAASIKYVQSLYDNCKLTPTYSPEDVLDLLKNKDNFILMYPTFIYKDIAIARPDFIVKQNNKIYLIETKGTSTIKQSHLMDIGFQANVVNWNLNKLDLYIEEYYICLVKYCLAKKNEVPLTLTKFATISKTGNNAISTDVPEYSEEYITKKSLVKTAHFHGLKLKEGFTYKEIIENENFIPKYLLDRSKDNKIKDKEQYRLDLFNKYIKNTENFDKIIMELKNHKIDYNPQFIPLCDKEQYRSYKSIFKDVDYWLSLREYYFANPNYPQFHFSGKIKTYEECFNAWKNNLTYDEILDQIPTIESNQNGKYFKLFKSFKQKNFKFGYLSEQATDSIAKFHSTVRKKVYFDFESINLAVRVIDDTLPFMQTCYQVSVIFDHGDKRYVKKNGLSGCDNIVIDPLTMQLDSYKEIIDAILPFDKYEDLKKNDEYTYIVYNIGFERSRLNEIAHLFKKINDIEYYNKAHTIINHLFDLADFFNLENPSSIAIEELKGFYSIKKVLKLIEHADSEIFNEVGCKDYKKLDQIQNGALAQKYATKRFWNLLSEQEWKTINNNLKIYCENDVRAMIAVEYFAINIITGKYKL